MLSTFAGHLYIFIFEVSAHFLSPCIDWVLCILSVKFYKFFINFGSLSEVCVEKIFSHSVGSLFTLLIVSFAEKKLFSLNLFILIQALLVRVSSFPCVWEPFESIFYHSTYFIHAKLCISHKLVSVLYMFTGIYTWIFVYVCCIYMCVYMCTSFLSRVMIKSSFSENKQTLFKFWS